MWDKLELEFWKIMRRRCREGCDYGNPIHPLGHNTNDLERGYAAKELEVAVRLQLAPAWMLNVA